jgi:hypothetical protein
LEPNHGRNDTAADRIFEVPIFARRSWSRVRKFAESDEEYGCPIHAG